MNIYLPFSPIPLRIRDSGSNNEVFDIFRKKWVKLVPEEYIRQQFLHHMVRSLNYPITSIAVEKVVNYHKKKKRLDAVVVGEDATLLMVLEFKRPDVFLTMETMLQASTYAYALQVRSIFLTNGKQQFFMAYLPEGNFFTGNELPTYQDLLSLM